MFGDDRAPDPLEGPDAGAGWRTGERPWTLLPPVARAADPLDPDGFLGIVPVALDCALGVPAEIGGEFELIKIAELRPKHTLSLGFGVMSPAIDPPDVVPSLGTWIIGPGSVEIGLGLAPTELCVPTSSLDVAMFKSSRFGMGAGDE